MVLLHRAAAQQAEPEAQLPRLKPLRLSLVSLTAIASPNHNNVTLKVTVDGEAQTLESHEGVGPIDAICGALKPYMTGVSFQKLAMVSEAPGASAVAKASVELSWQSARFMGESSHPNTLFAMAEAIVRALDNIAAFRERIGAGKVPAVRSDLWAGFIVDVGGGTRNGNSKSYALFDVSVAPCGTIRAHHVSDSRGKQRRGLAKAFHFEGRLLTIDTKSVGGDPCHLFIEAEGREPCQLN